MSALTELVNYALDLADKLRVAEEGWAYEYGLGEEDISEYEARYDLDCFRIKVLHQKILKERR